MIWTLPDPPPLVSVIIPTRDRASLLARSAWGVLARTDYHPLELLIVDNDSREAETAAVLADLAQDARVRVLHHPGGFNFAAINNHAVQEARGEIVVLLNNDVDVIRPDWLGEMVGQALRPDVGAVGAKLLYADGRLQHGGVVLGPGLAATHILRLAERDDPGVNGQLALARSLLCVTGACLAMRRAVFLEVGGLNAERLGIAFNDLDLCLRVGELRLPRGVDAVRGAFPPRKPEPRHARHAGETGAGGTRGGLSLALLAPRLRPRPVPQPQPDLRLA